MTIETLDDILASDIAGRFDISRTEANRIADAARLEADPAAAFLRIWRDHAWWSDGDAENDGMTAELRDDIWTVADADGGRWWPNDAAAEEIATSDDPAAAAVSMCRDYPMAGKWRA